MELSQVEDRGDARDQAVPGSLYSLVLHNFELLEKEVKHCHLKLPYKYVHVQLPMTLKLDGFFEDLLSGKLHLILELGIQGLLKEAPGVLGK